MAALREYDRLGEDAFLARYGFDKARVFYLRYDGKRYASKAIVGVAHGYLDGHAPLRSGDFTGGEQTVARKLRDLGFTVPPRRSPDWTRDEVILACEIVADNGWRQIEDTDPRVIELSGLLQLLPIHPHERRSDTFRNPNGVARKTADIASQHPDYRGRPTNGGEMDRHVLQDFLEQPEHMRVIAAFLRNAARDETFQRSEILSTDEPELDVDAETEAKEGRLLMRWHYARERDRGLRNKKIKKFAKDNGHVFCEVCSFDFEKVYGPRGALFAECHHVVPLHASGDTVTMLDDLILLCANCHRMIHRRTPWLTPDQLRALVTANRTS
ncbi:5-methylcytosine-specific restriction protein A [Nocardia mexicana]|uniref:5-methylcytosine-specific restriction protein A n=1 Tax=Nocardia mexicana TaxID=279262 RepID=A0A370HKE6_9NOCA|nr:5-methylcytosine-specific restriction protein A [Nocardia mexicana]